VNAASYSERLVSSALACCTWEQEAPVAWEQRVVPDACVDSHRPAPAPASGAGIEPRRPLRRRPRPGRIAAGLDRGVTSAGC
jgi:hypothetical protein